MATIGSLLERKGSKVWSVVVGTTVYDALALMADKRVGALPVLSETNRLIGIVSERDYTRKIVVKDKDAKTTPVQEIMTPVDDMYCVNSDTPTEEAMVLINTKKIRHLPVFHQHQFIGIVSIGDLLKSVIEEKEYTIDQLNRYISGEYM